MTRDGADSVIVVRCTITSVEIAPHKWLDVGASITSVLQDHPEERPSDAQPREEANDD